MSKCVFCVPYTKTCALYTDFCGLYTESFCLFLAKCCIFIWNPEPKFLHILTSYVEIMIN